MPAASNAQNHNQFTAGGSQIELRNLPTLVLVNGQRIALDAVAGLTGSKDFVDVSQIPAAALERVDVLTDGASSLYGSDAIGGVVNFILKHDYHGVTVGTHYGTADGGYRDRSAFVTVGGDVGPVNITATAQLRQDQPALADQPVVHAARSTASFRARPCRASSAGATTCWRRVCSRPPYRPAPPPRQPATRSCRQASTTPPARRSSPTASTIRNTRCSCSSRSTGTSSRTSPRKPFFGDQIEAFGDVLVSQNKVRSTAWQLRASPFRCHPLTVPAGSPYDPLTTAATE